jgi:hypothetical protein
MIVSCDFFVGEVCAPVSCNWHVKDWVRGYGIFADLNWVTFFDDIFMLCSIFYYAKITV